MFLLKGANPRFGIDQPVCTLYGFQMWLGSQVFLNLAKFQMDLNTQNSPEVILEKV